MPFLVLEYDINIWICPTSALLLLRPWPLDGDILILLSERGMDDFSMDLRLVGLW